MKIFEMRQFAIESDSKQIGPFSFEIRSGEIFGISDLSDVHLRLLTKFLNGENPVEKISGQVFCKDAEINPARLGRDLRISFLSQTVSFDPKLTCSENLFFQSCLKTEQASARAQVQEVLHSFELYSVADKYLQKLDLFSQKKFQLASAQIKNAALIVFAYPWTGLKLAQQKLLSQKIKNFAQQKSAVLIFSENHERIESVCDRILILDQGRYSIIGEPKKLKESSLGTQVIEIPLNVQEFDYFQKRIKEKNLKYFISDQSLCIFSKEGADLREHIQSFGFQQVTLRKTQLFDFFIQNKKDYKPELELA